MNTKTNSPLPFTVRRGHFADSVIDADGNEVGTATTAHEADSFCAALNAQSARIAELEAERDRLADDNRTLADLTRQANARVTIYGKTLVMAGSTNLLALADSDTPVEMPKPKTLATLLEQCEALHHLMAEIESGIYAGPAYRAARALLAKKEG